MRTVDEILLVAMSACQMSMEVDFVVKTTRTFRTMMFKNAKVFVSDVTVQSPHLYEFDATLLTHKPSICPHWCSLKQWGHSEPAVSYILIFLSPSMYKIPFLFSRGNTTARQKEPQSNNIVIPCESHPIFFFLLDLIREISYAQSMCSCEWMF